jgi:hypothetical protein
MKMTLDENAVFAALIFTFERDGYLKFEAMLEFRGGDGEWVHQAKSFGTKAEAMVWLTERISMA